MSNNNLPSILFNAIPKSAGRYCIEALRKGLKLEFSPIGTDMFPQGTLAPVLAMKFNEGGKISHGHIDYWWQPKVLLNAYVDRLLVHLRDPRSTTLEFYYHLLSLKANDWEGSERTGVSWLDLVHPSIKPKKYFELSKEEQIDVQIENCLPHMISFVEGWLDAEQDSEFKPKILFTTYKQLDEDEAAFSTKYSISMQLTNLCSRTKSLPQKLMKILISKVNCIIVMPNWKNGEKISHRSNRKRLIR
ncbi:MAG: hypothetical protein DRP56_10620 [Planctomycetota bacterium]|nr:MAG: hypothetical protein DRP56_10620 [Planctomycetota bacterium]